MTPLKCDSESSSQAGAGVKYSVFLYNLGQVLSLHQLPLFLLPSSWVHPIRNTPCLFPLARSLLSSFFWKIFSGSQSLGVKCRKGKKKDIAQIAEATACWGSRLHCSPHFTKDWKHSFIIKAQAEFIVYQHPREKHVLGTCEPRGIVIDAGDTMVSSQSPPLSRVSGRGGYECDDHTYTYYYRHSQGSLEWYFDYFWRRNCLHPVV
ncbi:uncharacterized protein LOC118012860 [Mirounga leonina]|uniref:uncharacterized protein LOC118012860 n=1 Tax=Mirounga leonina TaxID=9715 RepID=UPI00156C1EAD|nr:uncharacterized protein LOC118012860 [Mirounga leonina]